MRRCSVERLRRLKYDGDRTRKADQNGDKTGREGREAEVFEKLHGWILAADDRRLPYDGFKAVSP